MANAAVERAKHDTPVSLRMPLQTKELIESAAVLENKTFSAFVTESARSQAIDVLLDQAVFNLSPDQSKAFAEVLAKPPVPNQKLKELMQGKSPWER